ncbi:MAG: F0F1 ATP synthase subunit delta [Ureaplasma sp.]|nr:F0F1 ATP synthase subunit delta [Ureaplasma sp.]
MSKNIDLDSSFISSDSWNVNNTNYDKKDIEITIYSAFEMKKTDSDKIIELVSKKYNFTPYPINIKVDPELIGGVKVVFDSKVIDGSIKFKLDSIKNTSKERN